MPTIGRFSRMPPVEPKKPALPKLKMPPSEATSQYEELFGPLGQPSVGVMEAPAHPRSRRTRSPVRWPGQGEDRRRPRGSGSGSPDPHGSCLTVAPFAGLMP